MLIGYTSGVFDLFHIGHLNILKNAKGMCDKLIVGVTTDDLSFYKGKKPIIPFEERIEIVRSIKHVDAVVPQETMDKVAICRKINARVLFVGDDWYLSEKWIKHEEELANNNIQVVYFPYTKGVSSSTIRKILKDERGWSIWDKK